MMNNKIYTHPERGAKTVAELFQWYGRDWENLAKADGFKAQVSSIFSKKQMVAIGTLKIKGIPSIFNSSMSYEQLRAMFMVIAVYCKHGNWHWDDLFEIAVWLHEEANKQETNVV